MGLLQEDIRDKWKRTFIQVWHRETITPKVSFSTYLMELKFTGIFSCSSIQRLIRAGRMLWIFKSTICVMLLYAKDLNSRHHLNYIYYICSNAKLATCLIHNQKYWIIMVFSTIGFSGLVLLWHFVTAVLQQQKSKKTAALFLFAVYLTVLSCMFFIYVKFICRKVEYLESGCHLPWYG